MKMLNILFLLYFLLISSIASANNDSQLQYRYTPQAKLKDKYNILINTAFNDATKSIIIFHNEFENKTAMVYFNKNSSSKSEANTNIKYLEINKLQLIISGHNLSPQELELVFNDLKINFKKIPKVSLIQNLLPKKANAMDFQNQSHCNLNRNPDSGTSLSQLQNHVQNSTYVDLTLGCVKGALMGVWDATGGAIVDLSKTAWNLATSPIETVSSGYKTFKSMIKSLINLEDTINNFGDSFSKLSNEAKANMVCSFLSSIGTGIVIGILTAGATSPALVAQFTAYLSKFTKVVKLIEIVQKTGNMAKVFPNKFFNMMAEGKISEKILSRIEKFTNKNMSELAEASVACAIH